MIAIYVIYILLISYFLHEEIYLQNVHLYGTSVWRFFKITVTIIVEREQDDILNNLFFKARDNNALRLTVVNLKLFSC